MPQVIGGEATKIEAEQWTCGDCADAGKEFKEEESKVILHSVNAHSAYDVNRDTAKKVVRAVPKS